MDLGLYNLAIPFLGHYKGYYVSLNVAVTLLETVYSQLIIKFLLQEQGAAPASAIMKK